MDKIISDSKNGFWRDKQISSVGSQKIDIFNEIF